MKFICAIIFTCISSFAFSQTTICPDVEGAEQHPLLSNYKNSCIVGYNVTKFDMVTLPISKISSSEDEKKITVEGKVIDLLYGIENSQNITILEVQRNYEQAIKNSGLKIIYSAFGKKGVMQNNYSISKNYESIASPDYLDAFKFLKDPDYRLVFNHLGRNANNELAYFVAQGNKNGTDYTLMLYINYSKGNSSLIENKIFIQAKIIESESMETGQVSIASIDEKIKNEGKEVFHNILFDFGSANLTKESYAVIKTLSEYLKANPNQNYYIVGHTDNVGSLAANQTLSEKRAKAVLATLNTKYGIPKTQVSAHGVGQLSPLAINTTEEGRALNRRVEIVLK